MYSCSPLVDSSHIVPLPDKSQTFETFDSSLAADESFFTRSSHLEIPLSVGQDKARKVCSSPQLWWKPEDCQYTTEVLSTEPPCYESLSPWNSGLSTVSDSQSTRSSDSGSVLTINYLVPPPYQQEELLLSQFDGQPSTYPIPDSIGNVEPSLTLSKQHTFQVQLDKPSPSGGNEMFWSGSHSARTPTPETLPRDSIPVASKAKRRTRAQSISRVRKSTEKCTASTQSRRHRRTVTSFLDNETPRIFTCSFAPYGCESTFTSKNEWKRHVTSKHLLLGFYRCDVGKCNIHTQNTPFKSPKPRCTAPVPGQPNDFNRKDLFTQHQRRMHAPWVQARRRKAPTDNEYAEFESELEGVRKRCWHGLRQPPTRSHCGFCGEDFSGSCSWDARMEHVGRHFEREDPACLGDEVEDLALREWGLREGILTFLDGQVCLASLVETGG